MQSHLSSNNTIFVLLGYCKRGLMSRGGNLALYYAIKQRPQILESEDAVEKHSMVEGSDSIQIT